MCCLMENPRTELTTSSINKTKSPKKKKKKLTRILFNRYCFGPLLISCSYEDSIERQ